MVHVHVDGICYMYICVGVHESVVLYTCMYSERVMFPHIWDFLHNKNAIIIFYIIVHVL